MMMKKKKGGIERKKKKDIQVECNLIIYVSNSVLYKCNTKIRDIEL